MTTGFFHDERCLWHGGGNYAQMAPVGGLVQPIAGGGGLPEDPETKRRLVNLMNVTGLMDELHVASAPPLTREDLLRVHPADYLDTFKATSDAGGGELGRRTPFGPGGYEIACLSAGLVAAAMEAVLNGSYANAYALSRPPGHHALPDFPNGFCLLANIALAIRRTQARRLCQRVAVLDWDVHHGNGTEAIFGDDPDVLTISIHQENNYPLDTGAFETEAHANLNIPLPPGSGHVTYLAAMERLVLPALARFKPDVIVVACGLDAAVPDPLGRMLATAETFDAMTSQVMEAATTLCDGRLVMAHEGGYSEVYVPFCAHAVIVRMAGARAKAPDPFADIYAKRQPAADFDAFAEGRINAMAQTINSKR